jgi:hypothetical protein
MTKHGMIDTLLAMIESGEIALAQTRAEHAQATRLLNLLMDGLRSARYPSSCP